MTILHYWGVIQTNIVETYADDSPLIFSSTNLDKLSVGDF